MEPSRKNIINLWQEERLIKKEIHFKINNIMILLQFFKRQVMNKRNN
jgi:hypothetical protein